LVSNAYQNAKKILESNRELLYALAERLVSGRYNILHHREPAPCLVEVHLRRSSSSRRRSSNSKAMG